MAAGTVGYTDTRGNKDYLSMIASQIKNRVTEASDMANEERQFAEDRAEAGGTSLDEAGIGKGFFFGKALGSKFGGDAIAKTRGRFAKTPSAGIDPRGTAASRFRGGFDYNVTNVDLGGDGSSQNGMLANAVVTGFRGVEDATMQVSQALVKIDETLSGLERTQVNMARAIMFQGYMMAMLQREQQRASGRDSLRREERSIEGGGTRRIGGASFGGPSGGRGMVNVTGGGGMGGIPNVGGGGRNAALSRLDTLQTTAKIGANTKGLQQAAKLGSNARSALSLSKLSNNAGKLLNVPKTMMRSAISNATKFKNPLLGLKALKDSISAQSAAGLLGFGSKRVQFGNFFRRNAGSFDSLYDPAMDGIRRAKGGDLLDDLLGAPPTSAFQKATAKGVQRSSRRVLFSNNPYIATGKNTELLGQSVSLDANKQVFGEGAGLVKSKGTGSRFLKSQTAVKNSVGAMANPARVAGNAKRQIVKQFQKQLTIPGIKTTTNAAVENFGTAARIADLSDAGVKTADIATDQIVKKGMKKGLTKGSALARMMVKKFGAAGTKSILKQIPIVAGAAGVIFGIQRAMEGDFLGAALEIGSGLMGATGVGGGLSLGIDGFLLGRDLGMVPMAKGGLVSGPTNALVGEAGPELVTPLNDETFIKFGEGILDANKRNYSEFSKQNSSWLSNLGSGGEGDNSLFKIDFGGNDKVDLDGISSNVREIAPAINQLSKDLNNNAGSSSIVNNVVNNYGSGGKPGEGGGGEDNGGDFSSSGLDAFRLQYIGSLS